MPEPTATGPNGQKIVFRGGSWRDASTGAPVGAAPRQQAPINTGVDPRVSIAQNAEARQQTQFMQEQQDRQRETEEDERRIADAESSARSKLIATIGKLSQIGLDANDNNGWFETGSTGSIARAIFPSGAAGPTLGEDIKTAEARFAFDALQAMREASKTGGALGNVTERELDLLKAATAAINPDMEHETFMRNIEEARQAYLSKLAMVDPQAAARFGYDAAKAESAWKRYNDTYAAEMGYDDAQPIERRQTATRQYNPEDDALIAKYLD